jgi:hypothetical protein
MISGTPYQNLRILEKVIGKLIIPLSAAGLVSYLYTIKPMRKIKSILHKVRTSHRYILEEKMILIMLSMSRNVILTRSA